MDGKLKENFQYFIENQDEFVEKYNGKVVVLYECEVVGVYDKEVDAFEESKAKLPKGEFLIQRVTPGSDSYTQTFHSRVAFA